MFVKPATLGSSIGIGKANDRAGLEAHLNMVINLDRRIVIERAITDGVEINCAVLGDAREIVTSVLEQPVSWDEFLTYEEKYLRGGEGMKSADRIIPAPLSESLSSRIQNMARSAFEVIDGRGLARIDFLVRPQHDEVLVNEINTLPGSLALYLWTESGLRVQDVIARLVDIARQAQAEKRQNTYDYKTNLIALSAQRGVKGTKGSTIARRSP
jgi:D-alanine-D-alanine ligase